jgi:hypothetical protein
MWQILGLFGLAVLGYLVFGGLLWWYWNVGEDYHHIMEDEEEGPHDYMRPDDYHHR